MAYIKLVLTIRVYYLNQQWVTFLYKDPILWQLVLDGMNLFSSSSSRAFPVANALDVLQPCDLLYCP
jgi:hypothetical protein